MVKCLITAWSSLCMDLWRKINLVAYKTSEDIDGYKGPSISIPKCVLGFFHTEDWLSNI